MTDSELVQQAKQGNLEAFEAIIKKYESRVAGTVIGMLGNSEAADDVGQEVFIRLFKYLHKFREDATLGTYLTRIAINLSLNEIKKRKKRRLLFSENNEYTKEIRFDPDEAFDSRENRKLMQQAIQKLDPNFRSVLVLRLIEGYSTEETAQMLNIPLGTVLSRLARAQKKLKDYLAPYMTEEA